MGQTIPKERHPDVQVQGRQEPGRKKDRSLWWIAGIAVVVTAALIVASNMTARRLGEITLPEVILTDQERGGERNVLGSAAPPVDWWSSATSAAPPACRPTWRWETTSSSW